MSNLLYPSRRTNNNHQPPLVIHVRFKILGLYLGNIAAIDVKCRFGTSTSMEMTDNRLAVHHKAYESLLGKKHVNNRALAGRYCGPR